ncbi:MAG: methyltransferase [Chloroflexi bacterium]|nr:methyltransferase [Chloroflexota bacterium]
MAQRQGSKFSLTPLARDTLLPESARYIGGVLDHGEYLWWTWSGLTDLIKGGEWSQARRDLMAQLARTANYVKGYDEHFTWAMHGKAANGGAQFLASHLDLSERKLLLDVGGGPGTYSIALCQRFPQLQAVVWDVPDALNVSCQVIQQYNLTDRISLKTGDWDIDEFGTGYDVLLLSNVMHGPGSKAEMKLAKVFRSLESGGLLIINDFLLNDDKTGPLPAALFNVMIGAYSNEEIMSIVRKAGFIKITLISSDSTVGSGIITALRP